jgi:hypothetical protein
MDARVNLWILYIKIVFFHICKFEKSTFKFTQNQLYGCYAIIS